MNHERIQKFSRLICEKYDPMRFPGVVDCVMPGYFGGDHVMFIGQNPGELKEDVEGDMAYLRRFKEKMWDELEQVYVEALMSTRGTYGTFINDIYGKDWSQISITNVFKCPFIDNKIPDDIPDREMKIITRQIELVDPKVIVAVGTTARKAMIRQDGDIKGRVMYCQHPSYSKRTGMYDADVIKNSISLEVALQEHELSKPV